MSRAAQDMKASVLHIFDQVKILGQCGRRLNTGRIVDEDRETWTVAPLGKPGRWRFSKRTLRIVIPGRVTRPLFPRIAPCR